MTMKWDQLKKKIEKRYKSKRNEALIYRSLFDSINGEINAYQQVLDWMEQLGNEVEEEVFLGLRFAER